MRLPLPRRIPIWTLLVIPPFLFWAGVMMNKVAMVANNQQMPVMWQGGCNNYPHDTDTKHACMTENSRLKILGDWIDFGDDYQSPGDQVIDFANLILHPCFIAWCTLVLADRGWFKMRTNERNDSPAH